MTIIEAQRWAIQTLKKISTDSLARRPVRRSPDESRDGGGSFSEGGPALDAEIILAFVLKKTKEHLLTHPEKKLTTSQLTTYKKLVSRRTKHEPIAYITGHKDFYGLDFLVNKHVLIPRPETELMIGEVLNFISKNTKHFNISPPSMGGVGEGENINNPSPPPRLPHQGGGKNLRQKYTIIDVGTGSGCIPIAIAKNTTPSPNPLPSGERTKVRGIKLIATDISSSALKIARQNAKHHGLEKQITFLHGNLLQPLTKNYSLSPNPYSLIITANLPYGWKQWKNNSSAATTGLKFEPSLALFTKENGLYLYHKLFEQLKKNYSLIPSPYSLIIEFDPRQTKQLKSLIKKYFPKAKIEIKKDLAGLDRLAIIKL